MNNSGKAEEYHVRNGDHEETVIMKLPKTYEEQVEIIKKKGFIVDDDKMCKSFLKQANYYRLSAYFLPFRKTDGTYYENINFNRIKPLVSGTPFTINKGWVLYNQNSVKDATFSKKPVSGEAIFTI